MSGHVQEPREYITWQIYFQMVDGFPHEKCVMVGTWFWLLHLEFFKDLAKPFANRMNKIIFLLAFELLKCKKGKRLIFVIR